MGRRTTQRILNCAICGRTPEDGEYLWEMCGEYWCENCSDKENEGFEYQKDIADLMGNEFVDVSNCDV